jgi:hypothetical protein
VNWYDVGIQKLPLRLQKCIDRNGDYVEKWVHVQDSTDVSKIENKCLFYIFKHRRPYFWNYLRTTYIRMAHNINTHNLIFETLHERYRRQQYTHPKLHNRSGIKHAEYSQCMYKRNKNNPTNRKVEKHGQAAYVTAKKYTNVEKTKYKEINYNSVLFMYCRW